MIPTEPRDTLVSVFVVSAVPGRDHALRLGIVNGSGVVSALVLVHSTRASYYSWTPVEGSPAGWS